MHEQTIKKETVLVAIGGNSLIRKAQAGTIEEQLGNPTFLPGSMGTKVEAAVQFM